MGICFWLKEDHMIDSSDIIDYTHSSHTKGL